MEKMRTILRNLMDKAGHSPYDIERISGLPAATTYRFLEGKIGSPSPPTVKKWAQVYCLSESQLRGDVPIDGIEIPEETPALKDLLPLDEYHHVALVKRMDKETRAILYRLAEKLSDPQPNGPSLESGDRRRKDSVLPNPQLRAGEQFYKAPRQRRLKDLSDGRHINGSGNSQIA